MLNNQLPPHMGSLVDRGGASLPQMINGTLGNHPPCATKTNTEPLGELQR